MSASSTTPHLRRAHPDDLDALVALEERSFSGDRLSRRQYRRHLQSASANVFVATREGTLIGAAVLLFRRGSRVARLYSIAIDADARGQGIGGCLLRTIEQAAREHGCDRLRLEVRDDNAAAQALYVRHGFRLRGRRAGYYEDGADARLYEQRLCAMSE